MTDLGRALIYTGIMMVITLGLLVWQEWNNND